MITASRNGKFLRINGNSTEWVDDEAQATVFASPAAFAQCCATGRIAHLGLTFAGWVR